jgi:phage tail sheath gpL-like
MTIGFQKTPGTPVEISFDAELGLPNDQQELLLIGRAASGATGVATVITISNVSDVDAATTEAETKFGSGSELAKMVIAAVNANAAEARSTFPPIKCVPLESTDTTITAAAQIAVKSVKAEFIVSPFDASTDTTNRSTLSDLASTMSAAARVENNQFGSMGVAANMSVSDPADLDSPDTQYPTLAWFKNSAPDITVGELAAAYAAVLAGNVSPFIPVNGYVLGGIDAPDAQSDRITVGAGLESETALTAGWTPIKVKPNDDVAIVRSVTSRITTNGTVAAGAYYDVQDFQVLYFWRKTLYTRFNQTDFSNAKASVDKARAIKSEAIRLAQIFEDNEMFKSVSDLAKQFTVVVNASDRHRFDVVTPVNVIPGLHLIATTVRAGTQFDSITV